MFIHVTDPVDNTRILLNASCVLMVRGTVHGGSAIYLSTSAAHHPDVLLARETPEEMQALLTGDAPARTMAETPVETARPAH